MHVLLTVRGLRKREGGPTYTIPAMASALLGRGCEVSILVDDYDIQDLPGCEIHRRGNLDVPLTTFVQMFDVVHDNGVWLPFNHAVASACRRAHVPRVVTPHGALQHWIVNHNRIRKMLAWRLYQKHDLDTCQSILATAPIEAEDIRDLGYKGRMDLIPNGVDAPGAYAPKGFGTARKEVLFLSRIHEKKGVSELLDAWIKIRPKGWHLTMAGPDESGLVPGFKEQLERAGLADTVTFPGPLSGDARVEAFRNAAFFVLPTHSENFGLVVIEAMLMGTAVLTTTGTPWGEFESLGIGWICKPEGAAIEDKLRCVLDLEGNVFLETGRMAHAWAADRFTWNTVAEQTVDCYRDILAGWPSK